MSYTVLRADTVRTAKHYADVIKYGIDTSYAHGLLRYGVKIDKHQSDPATAVTYTYDAVGKTPAVMGASGKIDLNSWAGAWFVRDNYPCTVTAAGVVTRLDHNNYSKTYMTGATVSLTDTSLYFMSRIPTVWVQIRDERDYLYLTVCNKQFDSSYKAIAHTFYDSTNDVDIVKDEIFLSIYEAFANSSKFYSMSGKVPTRSLQIDTAITYAKAVGSGWGIRTWNQRQLINILLIIMGKTLNIGSVFGVGSAASTSNTGALNTSGQFYGTSSTSNFTKVFHMENWWGRYGENIAGAYVKDEELYVLTHEDNAPTIASTLLTATNSNYTDAGIICKTHNGSSIVDMYCTKFAGSDYGIIPRAFSTDASTTYWCEKSNINTSSFCAEVGTTNAWTINFNQTTLASTSNANRCYGLSYIPS